MKTRSNCQPRLSRRITTISAWTVATLLLHTLTAEGATQKYPDGRPVATLRMDAADSGVVLRHGDGPGRCDLLGARDVWVFKHDDTYYMHYDAAGPEGWLCALAVSRDLVTWKKQGPVLDFGKPGEDDSKSASYGVTYHDGQEWHMFYLGTPNVSSPPDRVPSFPYLTMKAKALQPAGPWIKQRDVVPFRTKPDTYYSITASPGQVIKHGDEFLQFFSATSRKAGNPCVQRTLGIARTKNLDGPWSVDPQPMVPIEEQIENSSLYYEKKIETWFLFTNHIGVDQGEFTDAVWVYWSKDLNQWDPENKAVVLDSRNCTWSHKCIGLPSVVPVGNRLALFYDAPGGNSTSHMKRNIGLAWLDLPLSFSGEAKPPANPSASAAMESRDNTTVLLAQADAQPLKLRSPVTRTRVATYSLADDFSYTDNRTNSTWSYRLADYAVKPPAFLPLLTSTNRNAKALWGPNFAEPPMMWSEGTGFWGIGKNTTGVAQTGSGVTWRPGEVLLHPKAGASPAGLVIAWTAPRGMVIDVGYTFTRGMTQGNGVGYELIKRSGGVDTIVAFDAVGSSLARSFEGVSVAAGDQLFFCFDTLGDPSGDITQAAIEITEAATHSVAGEITKAAGAPVMVTPPSGLTLWYDQPAGQWLEALPVGNGRLGCMIFGGVKSERLQLNEVSVWSGSPQESDNLSALVALPEVRQLLFDGKYTEANALAIKELRCKGVGSNLANGANVPFGCFQTLGDLALELDAQGQPGDYRRELDLETAVVKVSSLGTLRFQR